MIELDNISYSYEDAAALKPMTIEIRRGETAVLQGPNGCGKSTLLKLLNGLIYSDTGEYRFEGRRIDRAALKNSGFSKWFHQRVGFVFQNADTQLFCASVADEIAFGPLQMGLSDEEVARRTEDCLHLLGIERLRERAPYHLSGGEKHKVALACVLSLNPEVLVLDEPLAGLDEASQAWLLDFLLGLRAAGKTLVLSTHSAALAQSIADCRILLNAEHELTEVVRETRN